MGTEKPTTEFRKTPVVFVGTVKSVNSADSKELGDEFNFNDLRTTFSIDEAFKGVKKDEVDIYTSSQGTACGISFEEGEKVLVYAYGGNENRKYYSTSICTRTRLAEDKEDEIAVLRSLAKGKIEPRIYGTVYELIRGIDPLKQDYWESRKAMPNIKIIARQGNKKFEAISDTKGQFRIVGLPIGKYKLEFLIPPTHKLGGDLWDESIREKDQYKNIEVEITKNDNPDNLTIETKIDGRIKGRVFNISGKPVGEDVRVVLVTTETANQEVGDIDSIPAYTDKNGYFEFFGIPQGAYFLGFNLDSKPNKEFPYPRVYYPNIRETSKATPIILGRAEKLEGFNLYLPQKVTEIIVKGKVVDANDNPIKGAVVERYGLYSSEWKEGDPYSMKYIKQPTFEGRVLTNQYGEFELTLLKGNKYRLNSYLEKEGSHEDLLEGDDLDIEVDENIKPIVLVLDKKPE
jgi:hypothetical protein